MSLALVFVLVLLCLIAAFASIYYLSFSKKTKTVKTDTLKQLLENSKNENLSDEELKELVLEFVKTQNTQERLNNKLEFVKNIAANKNSSAKTIILLNQNFKKMFSTLSKEVEIQEELGLQERNNKTKE